VTFLVLAAFVATRAAAQSQWREYVYPDQQFAVSFPAEPAMAAVPSDSADGPRATERVYFVQRGTGRFEIAVFDLLRAHMDEPTVIGRAAGAIRQKGEVKIDLAAEVQGHWGRYFSLVGRDGSHTVAAVFFRNDRLYEIEATASASEFDSVSSDMVRFQQSLRFVGSPRGRRFAPPPAEGTFQILGNRLFAPGISPR
jgi:hypothetical protein